MRLDITKLTNYVYPERSRFTVIYKVRSPEGHEYSQGFECLATSAVEAVCDGDRQLNKYCKEVTKLSLESVTYLSSVADHVKEINKHNYD